MVGIMDRDALVKTATDVIASGCGCDRACEKYPNDCGCRNDAVYIIRLAYTTLAETITPMALRDDHNINEVIAEIEELMP